MIPLAIDGYLREQDMLQALVEDVVFSPPGEVPPYAALHVGVASRGESSKTGRGQGIVFDAPRSLALLRASVQGKSAQDRLFRISSDLYKRWWRAAAKGVCGAQEHLVGPAHSARHTGASRDMAEQYRDFAEIKRRGRWKTDDAVQRYAKVHVWATVQAATPPEIRARGRELLALHPRRPERPRG